MKSRFLSGKRILVILAMLFAMNSNAQWEPDVRLTNNPNSSSAPGFATNGNVVHVIWNDGRDGNSEIYYKRSTDAGITWGLDTRLTNDSAYSGGPSIAVSGSIVHVVWMDERYNREIYYKRSTDAGITWGLDIRLTNNSSQSGSPSIAVSGSIVHLVWDDNPVTSNDEIYYKRSTDGGITWETDTRLTNEISGSNHPSIAVSGSIVHVVWQDFRLGNYEIFYKRSTDGGITWGTDIQLTNIFGSSINPSIAVSGSFVHLEWDDNRLTNSNYEIFYKRSTDGGINWETDIRLTYMEGISGWSSIAVSGSNVHIVWKDYVFYYKIFYKRSTNNGLNWSLDSVLTNVNQYTGFPKIAVSGTIVHVVFSDDRHGNEEIYYKRNPSGNTIGIQNISTETPSKYSLLQNYPNPFNSTSNLKFQIVNSGDVKLIVYDIMGKEVQTLVNERLQPGTYEATFDASSLNSGVYFYKLITNGFTETKKMLLIK